MADSTTPNRGFTLPTVGADNNTWGGILDADITAIDAILAKAGFMASFAEAMDSSWTAGSTIVFDTVGGNGYNLSSGYSTSTGKYTAPVSGYYIVHCGLYLTDSAGNNQQMTVTPYINGVQTGNGVDGYPAITATPYNVGGTIGLTMTAVLHLNSGDVLELRAVGTTTRIYQGKSWFGAHMICSD